MEYRILFLKAGQIPPVGSTGKKLTSNDGIM